MKYHLGCGSDILVGYGNYDLHDGPGVDRAVDLSRIYLDNADEVFSNAFFEHLYVRDRISHLIRIYESLTENGFICYLGLPYFPGIAEAYLGGYPSTSNPRRAFDLYHVWRYTHGAPEEDADYLPQLHKGLFDEGEFRRIFTGAGINHAQTFAYVYPKEPEGVRVTCGFYVSRKKIDLPVVRKYLSKWDGIYLDNRSLIYL